MMIRKHFITRISFLAMLLPSVLLTTCKTADEPKKTIGTDISFHELLLPVPRTAQFIDDDYFNWGGSMIRTDDGVCHLFYSRWPKTYSFGHWVSHSEIAYAVADDPLGPKPLVSKIEVQWEDGSIDKVNKFERPQIYFEDGKPKVLFVAFRYTSDHSWNIHVPLLTDF